ncbi:MAG: YezD family protein [Methylobacter sp.]|nr:YezD family protein [Methylobacter sp.]
MALKLESSQSEPRLSEVATQIADILQEIRFGSIEITIHEGKVVQIERKEKLRFDNKK